VTNSRPILKAHAYGNDFLYMTDADARGADPRDLARAVCNRHEGIGADGLILYTEARGEPPRARMRLINSDGSDAEVSGNGVRGLGALLARAHGLTPGATVGIETAAGLKPLELKAIEEGRYTFRAAMGHPEHLRRATLDVAGTSLEVAILSMGNPQCVVLGPLPSTAELARLGPALERHPAFPSGTNVEFAEVLGGNEIQILIWERGAGPTMSSGTGSCAAAVVGAAFGGSARDVRVTAPGGTQRVEWRDEGVFLTGWAEIMLEGRWVGGIRS
jgi:diaminopimelate epimerase